MVDRLWHFLLDETIHRAGKIVIFPKKFGQISIEYRPCLLRAISKPIREHFSDFYSSSTHLPRDGYGWEDLVRSGADQCRLGFQVPSKSFEEVLFHSAESRLN